LAAAIEPDRNRPPVVILCEPQLGENIGAVARAMLNCGLDELRLVNPRDGWPSATATAAAAGADRVLDGVHLYGTTEAAIADLNLVLATTARPRDLVKPVLWPSEAAARVVAAAAAGQRVGLLFGCERSGLTNDQVVLADAVLTFPLNPDFTSLNLAQAVLLAGWEWRRAVGGAVLPTEEVDPDPPAARGALVHLFEHMERELDAGGFFFPPEKRPYMIRNVRTLLARAGITDQNIRTLHGMIVCLTRVRHR
jgi:tRNA/rRNA methyltransferase